MVDARDGICHQLDADRHGDDLVAGRTYFRALCGHPLLAASLATPAGPACERCGSEVRRREAADRALRAAAPGGPQWGGRDSETSGWWRRWSPG